MGATRPLRCKGEVGVRGESKELLGPLLLSCAEWQQSSAKINISYSILFNLTTSYSSYFGGKKGISRNKTSFFLLMHCITIASLSHHHHVAIVLSVLSHCHGAIMSSVLSLHHRCHFVVIIATLLLHRHVTLLLCCYCHCHVIALLLLSLLCHHCVVALLLLSSLCHHCVIA